MTATVDEQTTVTVRGACPHDCPDTCAMLVSVRGGRAVEVRGDPGHPFTRGGLCVKVNNYVDKAYSPERVLYPMRRAGPKGSGQFTRISWEEALDEIAGRFRSAIAEHGPETVMPVSYLGTEGILNGLNVGDPFFNKLGATITERTYCDSGACTAYTMTIGATAGVDPESLVQSRYILIWACNMISTNLHLWPFVAEAQRRGAKVVVIDPVRHRTAAHADWYIPIRPGTDGALALAMMNVIIGEGLTDEAYVRDYTVGYEELAERVQHYTPEWASEQTGIPADDIRTLAREYATSQPSMIRIGVAIERHAGGGQTVRSIACLPALAGAWRRVGGGLLQLPLWAFPVNWPALLHPELATPGTRVVNQFLLGRALTGELGLDPPVTALMVYNSNPVVVCPEQDKMVAGLSREDLFTVVSEHFLTDTARYADLVLPATTQLEQHDIMFSWGHLYVTLNTPAIEPVGEAISNTELFRRLAGRMGFTEECFTRTDEQMMAEAFDWSAPAMAGTYTRTTPRSAASPTASTSGCSTTAASLSLWPGSPTRSPPEWSWRRWGPGPRTPRATPPSTRSTRLYSPTSAMPRHSPTPKSRSNRPSRRQLTANSILPAQTSSASGSEAVRAGYRGPVYGTGWTIAVALPAAFGIKFFDLVVSAVLLPVGAWLTATRPARRADLDRDRVRAGRLLHRTLPQAAPARAANGPRVPGRTRRGHTPLAAATPVTRCSHGR